MLRYYDDNYFKENEAAIREEIGEYTVVPNGTVWTIGSNSTGIFAGYEGQTVRLLAGGKLDPLPSIGTFQVDSERSKDEIIEMEGGLILTPGVPDRSSLNTVYFELTEQVGPSGNPPVVNCFYRACEDSEMFGNQNPSNGCVIDSLADFKGDTAISPGVCGQGAKGTYFRPRIFQGLPWNLGCILVGDRHTPLPISPCKWQNSPPPSIVQP